VESAVENSRQVPKLMMAERVVNGRLLTTCGNVENGARRGSMPIRVKDTNALAKKFVQRAQGAAGDYKTGVEATGQDWESGARAGAENYKQAVVEAANAGRFEKGVSRAGAAKWSTRAASLGAQRYPTGVGAAEGDWSRGSQPYLEAIRATDLPPRRPKGDPANHQRSIAIATRLRAIKLGQ
jgi:hypothetical protein